MQVIQDMWTNFMFLASGNDKKIYFHGNDFLISAKYYTCEDI